MTFTCNGSRYDTSQMFVVDVPGPFGTSIYVTPDHLCAFILEFHHENGVHVRQLGQDEVRHYADALNAPALWKALEAMGNPAV